MAHITLSIPDELHREMKKRAEVKWSEIARASIREYLGKRKNTISSKELLKMLPEETRKGIMSMDEKKAAEFYKKVGKEEWKRIKSLTRTS